ncbi:Hypothetical predicted protein, partial [Paramuricea clavata]
MYVKSGVCHIGISDHSLVYAIRKLCVSRKDPRIIRSRQFRDFNANSFRYDLSLAPWHIVEEYENDPNLAWDAWKTIFLKISDIHAPNRSRKIRNKHSPWLTPELKKLMFERDRLKRIASKHDTERNWSKYPEVHEIMLTDVYKMPKLHIITITLEIALVILKTHGK